MQLEFEEQGDKRIKHTQVGRIANQMVAQDAQRLEERRALLKTQLAQEEASYMQEAEASAETPLDRQSKMRTRARELRDKRESIRAKIASEKLNTAWSQNCEPLRTLTSRKNHEKIDMDRKVQIEQNHEMAKRDKWVEEMYAESWKLDQIAKKARESAQIARRRQESRHLTEVLDAQVGMLEMNREEEKELGAKEQEWRLAAAKLAEEEDRLVEEAAVVKKRRVKAMLDKDVSQKADERNATHAGEMERDLALLEQLSVEKAEMGDAMVARKKQLMAETAMYRQYIKDCATADAEREVMIDTYMEVERKKQARKRHMKVKAEKKKRAEMMLDVIEVLQEQMQYGWNKMMQERAEKQNEAQQIIRGIAHLNAQAEAKEIELAQENKLHQTKLLEQCATNEHRRRTVIHNEAQFATQLLDNHVQEEQKINATIARIASLDMSVSGSGMGGMSVSGSKMKTQQYQQFDSTLY